MLISNVPSSLGRTAAGPVATMTVWTWNRALRCFCWRSKSLRRLLLWGWLWFSLFCFLCFFGWSVGFGGAFFWRGLEGGRGKKSSLGFLVVVIFSVRKRERWVDGWGYTYAWAHSNLIWLVFLLIFLALWLAAHAPPLSSATQEKTFVYSTSSRELRDNQRKFTQLQVKERHSQVGMNLWNTRSQGTHYVNHWKRHLATGSYKHAIQNSHPLK